MIFRIVAASALFVFSLTTAQEEVKDFAEISRKCEEKNNLKNGEILLINSSKPIETDNIDLKCYFRCLLTELNLMDEEGEIILNGMAGIKREYWKYIMACIGTTGSGPCDKALNFENCVWTKRAENES